VSTSRLSRLRPAGLAGRPPGSPGGARRSLAVTVVLGAVGAGLVFLATRQGWAQVRTVPPRPLPVSLVSVTGAALVPYFDALILVGLASLAAVLATRKLLRRLTGILLAALGIGVAVSAFAVSRAAAISAAAAASTPSGSGAGSVTSGSHPATSTVPEVAGATPHVAFTAVGWQVLVLVGALAMIAAGVLVVRGAEKMAVMSSRYDAPAGKTAEVRPAGPEVSGMRDGTRPDWQSGASMDSASVWEALSHGDDPTTVNPANLATHHGRNPAGE
jgi:uncharacterized membrane protein (TIGR02234 family)